MPEPSGAQPANFDPLSLDVKIWLGDEARPQRPALEIEYPTINRALKGDRLPLPQTSPESTEPESLPQLQPIDAPEAPAISPPPAPPPPAAPPKLKNAEEPEGATPAQSEVAVGAPLSILPAEPQSSDPATSAQTDSVATDERNSANGSDGEDDAAPLDKPPEIPAPAENSTAAESNGAEPAPSPFMSLSFLDEDQSERNAQLYFGVGVMGASGGLEQWAPGAAPVLVSRPIDSDIKLSALEEPTDADAGAGGETVATKDDASRTESPADRLGLADKRRAKAEKCLADAVYFEARGEPLRGQQAVAQVVMNRVFSGYYPHDVCGVVYQNSGRYLACQFTFACEGRNLNKIDEPDMWEQAKRIAKDTLDGKIWLAEVGHATHYHAYWVHPSWVNEMKKLYKLGVHTFYRPRAWGDGSDAPAWGNLPTSPSAPQPAGAAAEKPDAAKDPAPAAKRPEADASPAEAAPGKVEPTAKL